MRLLIDESIPVQIEPYLSEFHPSTVRRERLKGLRNGVLLRAAVDRGFNVIFSADQTLTAVQPGSVIEVFPDWQILATPELRTRRPQATGRGRRGGGL